MITDKNRSGWFGASDVSYIMGNWTTQSFKNWWLEKLDLRKNAFESKAMRTGTYFEHKILDKIPGVEKDRQVLLPEYRLRINLDGNTENTIYEVKTTGKDNFKPSKSNIGQVNIQMFGTGIRKAFVVSYCLMPEDYRNYFAEIDEDRMAFHAIEYDEEFIEKFLERITKLKECMGNGVMQK